MKGMLLFTAAAIAVTGAADYETTDEMIMSGIASQYGRGRMMSNIRVRQAGRTAYDLPTPVPQADVYFATIDCSDIGTWFKIRRAGEDETGQPYAWETAYAADCAGLSDGGLGFMLFNRPVPMSRYQANIWLERVRQGEYQPVYVAEVDYETAVRWDTVGRGQPVELVKLHPEGVE
ncbi:MAG: hypothetical protein ACP5GX_06185 [Anaerolineae bacterium]